MKVDSSSSDARAMTTAMAHARQMQDKLREESRSYETLAEGAWTTTTATRRAKERESELRAISMSAGMMTMREAMTRE